MKSKSLTIILGCYYLKDDESYILNKYYKKNICVSNEQYERKLFNGFLETGEDFIFISAPRVGGFPFTSRKLFVKGFKENKHLKTIKYFSPYGLLNAFKTKALIRKVKQVLKEYGEPLNIHFVACEAHLPYLEVIKFFKKHNGKNSVFSTLIAPDMPSDMNKSTHHIYRFLKNRDVKKIQNICDLYVDSFLCFTPFINEKINRLQKKSFISEGIMEDHSLVKKGKNDLNHVVYIGKTDKRNGVQTIIEAAKMLPDNFVVEIIGSGDFDDVLKSLETKNVIFHGFVRPSGIDSYIKDADILLSPRFPDEDYVKYSFPSKIFEYLSFRKKIVTYRLPCYFKELDTLLLYPKGFSAKDLANAIVDAAKNDFALNESTLKKLISKYSPANVAKGIIELRGTTNE